MLNVAYVDVAREFGGAEQSLVELLAHLDLSQVQPLLLHTRSATWLGRAEIPGLELRAAFADIPVLKQARDDMPSGPAAAGSAAIQLLRLAAVASREARAFRTDLIHTNTLKSHLVGGIAARRRRLPLVWHMRDILPEGGGRRLLRRAAGLLRPRVIAISEAVASQFDGWPVEVSLIHNGVPLERFAPRPRSAELLAELGLRPDAPIIGNVSRLTPWKGHRTLLEALGLLKGRGLDFRALIVGEVAFWKDTYEGELKCYCSELGLDDRVIWTGFRDDIPELLALCDCFVLPSENEPFGRVIVEAMATGLPVVACRSGGVPEIVAEGETGLLVEPRDAAGLAEALATLLDGQEQAQAMGAAGRERALAHFDVRRVARQVQEVYIGLV